MKITTTHIWLTDIVYKSTKVVHTNYEQKQFDITRVIKKIQKNITFLGKVTPIYGTLAASLFYNATRSCTCSLVASINIARAMWQNSRKNISPLKCYTLHNIILRVKCYVTAATAFNQTKSFLSKNICLEKDFVWKKMILKQKLFEKNFFFEKKAFLKKKLKKKNFHLWDINVLANNQRCLDVLFLKLMVWHLCPIYRALYSCAPNSPKTMGTFFGADTGFKICPQTGFRANSESKSSDSESDCLDSPHLWWLMGAEQRWQRIRSGPGYPRFFADPVFSKKRIRIGSGSEFVSAPGNNLETKSALYFAETFLGIHLKYGRKNAPILSEVLFLVSLFLLWSSPEIGKNAQSKYCCADWWSGSYQSIHKVHCTTVLNYRET